MTEVESFGQPGSLLNSRSSPLVEMSAEIPMELSGKLGIIEDSTTGFCGVTTSVLEKVVSEGFGESLLLSRSLCATTNSVNSSAEGFGESSLLGGSSLGNILSSSIPASASSAQTSIKDVENGFGESSLFGITNALLSSTPSNLSAIPLSQSQDDEFPDISDILQSYPKASTGVNITTSSSLSFPSSHSLLRASTYDGKTVYLHRKTKRSQRFVHTTSTSQSFGKLLNVPIHRLMDELSITAANKIVQSDVQIASASAMAPALAPEQTDASLWVDRYRPQRFTELLGDDRVHREVMAWVKEWDWCVFGRKGQGRKRFRNDDDNEDEWRRPTEKFLLLSGPPGLGKTTLAHVIAQQAGYSVFEINASDARSASIVDERIRPAIESGYAVGSSKPVLVVIDEIDGATGGTDNSGGFIQRLVQLTYDRPKKKGRKADPKATRPLLRPIICICNDLYASSLTKLRPHARVVRLNRPNDVHLIKRLQHICDNEGVKANSRALSTLVGLAQGDLRGCLNTLQLIQSRNGEVTESIVRAATAGMKEAENSHTAVLNNLFAPLSRKRTKDLGISEEEEARYVTRLSREVEGSGAMDKIALGCFEHYANLHRHDGTFSRYLKANEWLSVYDLVSGEMRSEREYALMQYLPYMLVAFYPLFQERGGIKVERPKADWDNYVQTKTNEEIYKSLAHSLRTAAARRAGAFRHFANDQIMQLEFAPFINRIISPPLRPVNSQVIRPEERALLSRLVDVMVALELRFIQERTEEGQLVYRLDPPIDVFVTYDGKRASDIAISRFAVRHLVASEIDAKLITRQAEGFENGKTKKTDFFRKSTSADRPDGVATDKNRNANEALPNKRARLDDLVEKAPTDFFGRPIALPAGSKPVSKRPMKEYRVTYRHQDGNSAAVRKPIKVGAFL